MASMSVSGIVSGMDWESMIDEIITNAAKPAQPQVAKKTDLTNKKSLFEEMKTMMNSLQSSLSPLKLPSTYKAKEIEIERLDSTKSYKGVLTATVNADAEVNVWDVEVKQLATAQTNRSKQITASNLNSTLSGVTGSTMYIEAGGQKIGVEVKSNDTLDSLKSRINTTLKTLDNPIHVTASVVDNKLILKSDYTGLGSFTSTETINYSSNGYNTLTGFTVSDDTRENVKITNGSTTYTYGTDYVIVNGNEIRWKKYDQSKEVALDDTVTVKYNMAAGDKYEKTGTYGTNEADISRLSMIDNGTLSSRLKITDDNKVTYTYGKDFTLDSSGKVVWLEDTTSDTPITNEPDTYTVTYTKTETASSTISGTKKATDTTYTSEPESYIVKYNDRATGSYDVPISKVGGVYDSLGIDYDELNTLYTSETGSELNIKAIPSATALDPNRVLYFLDPADTSDFNLTDTNGNTYVYGRDYVIKTKDNTSDTSNGNWQIVWGNIGGGNIDGIVNTYKTYKGVAGSATDLAEVPSNGTQLTFSMDYDYDYSLTGRVSASDNDKTIHTIFGQDIENFNSSKLTIRGYANEIDYKVVTATDGESEIQWIDKTETAPSRDDAISSDDFTALTAAYRQAYGSSVPTVTLTDADGVLRTYLDPEDASLFTMASGSTTYEYGKDYVIRVNDDRNGYTISWAITDDVNGDTKTDINDASTVVTTYTKYKDLSTLNMKSAPAENASYNFSFSKDVTTATKGTVNKTSTDKSLLGVLNGASVPGSAYGTSALTITDGTYTYTYGTDYTIDESGNIEWIEQNPGAPVNYTVSYAPASWVNTVNYNSNNGYKYDTSNAIGYDYDSLASLIGVDTVTNSSSGFQYLDLYGNDTVSVTINGDEAVYGQNYVLRRNSTSNNNPGCVIFETRAAKIKEYRDSHSPVIAQDTSVNTSYSGTVPFNVSYSFSAAKGSTNEATVISSFTSDYLAGKVTADKITVKGSNGLVYTCNTSVTEESNLSSLGSREFAIINGEIMFRPSDSVPKQPDPGVGYTLSYESFSAITTTGTTNGTSSQEVSIKVDSGYGKYDGDKRSYEQILSDTGLTSSSKADDWAKYFTLATTDGTTTYKYGTDYTIIQGSDTDSSTGEHNVMINWLNAPASGTYFTLSYGGNGGEVLTTDGVKRSATDSVNGSPLATAFDGGTNTITYGSKTFYEGIDFDIDADSSGYATVTWISNKISDNDGGHEWYYPTSNSYYTINHTDDNGNTTTYNASRTGSATLSISEMKTANGSISVEYGGGLPYKLNAPDIEYDDGTSATIAEAIKAAYGFSVTPTTGNSYTFNWVAPTLTSRTNLPAYGTELTVEYEYDANTFDLSDDGDGDLLYALGFTDSSGNYDDYTEAKNAILVINGEQEVERDSNDIGESYENELIKGVTMHLKGVGQVSLDISQDAEKAVESIQSFVDSYNELMTWMNTRMTESQLDEDAKATVDSDDFRMRWGLLHGNSLLRQTKSQMRSLTSQNFTFSFTQRKSSEEIYGTMGFNGLKTSSTLRLRIGSKFVDVTIDPTDTLDSIVKKISDDTKGGAMNDIYYDDSGNKLATPLLKAYVENDKLVIQSSSNDEITMSGSAAMNALKMNYTYKGLYQLGIESTSNDYGKSGELEFDTDEFMTALEDNPDEVQSLMMTFVTQFDTWTKSMLNSSASGETSGTLTREIENIQTRIDSINEYLEKYQERLDRMEENLRTRYGNTETQFAKLSQQANSIAAILNQLNGTAQGGGYGQTSS